MSQGMQSIDRAAALLTLIINASTPVSFTEMVEQSGLARSTVSRLLTSLHENGLLERMADGRYRGGPLFAAYAARFDRTEALAAAAAPTLERLGEKTGETVNLGLPSGDRVVHAAQVDSQYVLGATNWVDIEVPSHCSALGLVLHAYGVLDLPSGPLARCADGVLVSEAAREEEAHAIRTRGYAITHGDFEEGLDAVAAPVRGPGGAVLAALGISGPSVRLSPRIDELGRLLVSEATELARGLTSLSAAGD
ncbi:MAG TPA: IclR family transcriptional regulator [Brevibacterium senegalense]|uniref:IclR family transcriptional regulator n=1 Tax=Brevibacterium senegalense TaxID=1033736 RepID=A0A921SP12_9MICO|nr:IclR family transcriptional regulator [Brevibacterium senegalense]